VDGPRLVVELGELRAPPDVSDVLVSNRKGLAPWMGLLWVCLLEASLEVKAPGSGADEWA
jgi:hypothetical protein